MNERQGVRPYVNEETRLKHVIKRGFGALVDTCLD